MVSGNTIRCSKDFKTFLREAQLAFIRKGRKPPSDEKLTQMIVDEMKKEDILYDKFISFQ